jgi:hypothetical protein
MTCLAGMYSYFQHLQRLKMMAGVLSVNQRGWLSPSMEYSDDGGDLSAIRHSFLDDFPNPIYDPTFFNL